MSQHLAINGFFILDKPIGLSSNQALQKVKRIFHAKKAGHTGTLDVLASGLLPICLGEATKFSQYLLNADKTYRTIAKLGERTTTCDAEGEVVETKSAKSISDELFLETVKKFLGETTQIPSMYSALKHQGKPLYQLARQGIEVERQARTIQIDELTMLEKKDDFVTLNVKCSKGTYIRNLVDDVGQALGCGAYVYALRRLDVGDFNESQMITIEALEQAKNPEKFLLPIDSALQHFPTIILSHEQIETIYFGQTFEINHSPIELIRLLDDENNFIGLGRIDVSGLMKSVRLLSRRPMQLSTAK